jgi:hypothetical protein
VSSPLAIFGIATLFLPGAVRKVAIAKGGCDADTRKPDQSTLFVPNHSITVVPEKGIYDTTNFEYNFTAAEHTGVQPNNNTERRESGLRCEVA